MAKICIFAFENKICHMKLPFGIQISRTNKKQLNFDRINDQAVNKLYEQIASLFSKNQIIWNKDDLKGMINEGYLFNPDVYAIINKIIQTASMTSWQMYEIKDKKSFSKYISYKKSLNLDAIQEYSIKSMEPVEEHDLLNLLEQPNKYTTGTLLDQNMLGYYCLLGNSYLNKIVIAGTNNIPGELQVLPAYMVKIIFGDNHDIVKSYTIDTWFNKSYEFQPDEIYHFKSFNPNYEMGQFMYGAKPSINPSLEKSNQSYIAAVNLIMNCGAMGILSSGNDSIIDTDSAKKIKEKYASEFAGAKNRGKVMVVGHKLDYTNIAQSITDLNLIQGQEQDFITLCRAYNVDTRIMGYVKGSTFSNMKEARQDFIQNRILPLKYMQSEAYNKFLMPAYNQKSNRQFYLDVDYKSIPELQLDMDRLSTRLQNEVKRGLLSPADAAKILGYPELTTPEAKQLWIGTDMIPMQKQPIVQPTNE